MTTILALIDWLASLNRWQMTLFVTVCLFAWLAAFILCARLLAGGNGPDALPDDDAEDAR